MKGYSPINIVWVFLDNKIWGCNPLIKKLKQVFFTDSDHDLVQIFTTKWCVSVH